MYKREWGKSGQATQQQVLQTGFGGAQGGQGAPVTTRRGNPDEVQGLLRRGRDYRDAVGCRFQALRLFSFYLTTPSA